MGQSFWPIGSPTRVRVQSSKLNTTKPRSLTSYPANCSASLHSTRPLAFPDHQFTRLVLSIQVLSAAVTLPSRFVVRPQVWKSLIVLLGPVMLLATFTVGAFAKL
jgi:hypothetical protein